MSQSTQAVRRPDAARPIFIARQPIFNLAREVYGYELLFRSDEVNRYTGQDGDTCTLDVIASGLIDIGLDELTGGHKAFINFTANLLKGEVPEMLPPQIVILEVLEDATVDDALIDACQKLKAAGYSLALDDFVLTDESHPLLSLANIVKVDFAQTTPEQRRTLAGQLARRGIVALAEKVETEDDYHQATSAGYSYFQGYFFSRPVVRQGTVINGNKLAHLQLLEQINRPDVTYDELAATIGQDVSLTFRLLRFINSAWVGLRQEVTSIRHALSLLGIRQIRKWVALVSLRILGLGKPGETVVQAMTRAKMAEDLAPLAGMKAQSANLFLMGLFSLIDALLEAPMADILARLPLAPPVKEALLDGAGPFSPLKELIESYERGEWDAFLRLTASLSVDARRVPAVFRDSLTWANRAFAWHEAEEKSNRAM